MKQFMNKKNIIFMAHFIICVVLIFIYGSYRCDNPDFKDPLQTKLRLFDLDGWSLSHFLFFMLIGYNYGGQYLVAAFILGVLWEGFEHYYGEKRPGWLGGYGDCNNMRTDPLEGNWWYGKYTDIIMNALGLLIGYYLQNKSLPFAF